MSENEIRVLYVQPGKYPEERTIPNTLRALQELVGGDIECCRPWRDSVCVMLNAGKIKAFRIGRSYRIPKVNVIRFLQNETPEDCNTVNATIDSVE